MFLELEVKREVTDYIYMHISYRTAGYCDELRSASNFFLWQNTTYVPTRENYDVKVDVTSSYKE